MSTAFVSAGAAPALPHPTHVPVPSLPCSHAPGATHALPSQVPHFGLVSTAVPVAAAAALVARRRHRKEKQTAVKVSMAAVAKPGASATSRKVVAEKVDLAPPEIDWDEEQPPQAAPKGNKHKQFDWMKAWYPVHVTEICDPVRPHKMQLLGMNIVIWNDGPTVDGKKQVGKWHVFEDACPHRQAPLSEGRVEADGSLLCSYHAWRFDGKGDCTDLPYSPEHLQPRHKCSCRAKVKVFPTREVDGLLFVWPDTGPNCWTESAAKDPPLIEELHDPALKDKWIKFPINLRDLELGWDVFFENAMDPSHFLVAHHNVTGNRYTDPKWFAMKGERSLDTDNGVAVKGLPGCFDFRPPCLVKNQQDGGVIFAIYNTPTSPGKCRHIGFLVLDTESIAGESGVVDKNAVQMFTGPVPIWLQHVLTSFFLHQDAVLLHHQEQNFRDKGFIAHKDSDKAFREVTYTPNEVDIGSIQFRRWLRTRAGGGVPWQCDPSLPPRLQDNTKIFDVWNSHTKHCTHCLEAYRNIQNLKTFSFGSAFAIALAVPDGPERIIGGAAAVAIGAGLHKLGELFEVYEFNHQDNN